MPTCNISNFLIRSAYHLLLTWSMWFRVPWLTLPNIADYKASNTQITEQNYLQTLITLLHHKPSRLQIKWNIITVNSALVYRKKQLIHLIEAMMNTQWMTINFVFNVVVVTRTMAVNPLLLKWWCWHYNDNRQPMAKQTTECYADCESNGEMLLTCIFRLYIM